MTGNGAWKNRIIGHEDVPPDQLLANPSNPRIHPARQQDALHGSLEELGWLQDVIVNQRTGYVLDGHARIKLALRHNQPTVPVKYVDLDPAEEALALVTFDPIGAMAAVDREQLERLLRDVNTGDAGLQAMIAEMAEDAGVTLATSDAWQDAFGGLPNSDRAPFQQMTFTLHDSQAEQVKEAMGIAAAMGAYDSPNENSNGNALARICETFIGDYGQG